MYHRSADISKIILYAEAAAYHRDLLLRRGEEYDPSVRWRFESGLFISGPDYLRALRHRREYTESARELLQGVDLLAGPMEPVVAPPIEAESVSVNGEPVGVIPALTQYTRPFNLTGYPALTVPCGFSEGMPVGLQLAARPFEEATALQGGVRIPAGDGLAQAQAANLGSTASASGLVNGGTRPDPWQAQDWLNVGPSRGKRHQGNGCVNCIGDGGWIELGCDELIYRQAGGH